MWTFFEDSEWFESTAAYGADCSGKSRTINALSFALVSSCLAFAVTPPLCIWPLPWRSRYLPEGDHVFGWQSVQPPAGAGVLQGQPQPLLPLQSGGHALCTRVYKGEEYIQMYTCREGLKFSHAAENAICTTWIQPEKERNVFGGIGRLRAVET